ncbi:hypothetical protein FDK12_02495 [Arthrobacter sp. NamB2]|uniref:hypothetical protein n=1 Tax=Arthrobacter sp. NamB2 TaxID=2576035 RepID=UPI0010C979A7|nr:hypothetical protein [Arthrobacter sp. NamB2]TKV29788.1 hypothetical protein FDK12_02495 [Arthrobacter sp. NamB2]
MKTAVPIIVAGLLLMLLGIGQRTIWAPAETVTASVAQDVESAPVTVIEPGARGDASGPVEVTVEADGPFTFAVGRSSDVEAWVGEAAHLSVTGISEDALSSQYSDGEETVPDPSGSDLWISEEPGDGTLTYRWSEPVEGDWSILLAADGEAPAPTQVSVTSPNDQSTPFALPLIIGGALVVVLGIALLFIAPRSRGGRSGDAAEGTRSYARRHARTGPSQGSPSIAAPGSILVVTGLVGAGSLLGIAPGMATTTPSPSEPATSTTTSTATSAASPTASSTSSATSSPTASSNPAAEGAPSAGSASSGPPVVLDSQLERILAAVASTVSNADAASDPKRLAARADGAALELRTGAYAVRAKDEQATAPAPVAAEPVRLSMIPTDTEWPRTIVALTQGDDNPVPQALLLVQESPRENYKLTSAVQMLPGSTFPSPAAPGASGPVPLDEAGALTTAPQDAVASIADFLTTPGGTHAETFEKNSFAEAITEFQSSVVADPGNQAANISFTHKAQPDRTQALLTGDGGAMVFGYLTHTYSSIPKAEGDTIDLKGTVYQSLTGQDTSEKGIDVNYGEAVMMYVPPAGSDDRIRVIGAAQQLLSATLR